MKSPTQHSQSNRRCEIIEMMAPLETRRFIKSPKHRNIQSWKNTGIRNFKGEHLLLLAPWWCHQLHLQQAARPFWEFQHVTSTFLVTSCFGYQLMKSPRGGRWIQDAGGCSQWQPTCSRGVSWHDFSMKKILQFSKSLLFSLHFMASLLQTPGQNGPSHGQPSVVQYLDLIRKNCDLRVEMLDFHVFNHCLCPTFTVSIYFFTSKLPNATSRGKLAQTNFPLKLQTSGQRLAMLVGYHEHGQYGQHQVQVLPSFDDSAELPTDFLGQYIKAFHVQSIWFRNPLLFPVWPGLGCSVWWRPLAKVCLEDALHGRCSVMMKICWANLWTFVFLGYQCLPPLHESCVDDGRFRDISSGEAALKSQKLDVAGPRVAEVVEELHFDATRRQRCVTRDEAETESDQVI